MSIKKAIVSNQLKFSFKIENFTEDTNEILESENFCFNKEEWKIKLYPTKNEGYIGIYLCKVSEGSTNLSWKISINDADGKVLETKKYIYKLIDSDGWGHPSFISREILFNAISPNYTFSVDCEMEFTEAIQPISASICSKMSMLKEISESNFHDLKIQVKGDPIPAHRLIVSAYSKVFHQVILELGDADPVIIEDFSFEVVQEVVNFVYGREVNKTDENIKEILLAAKKYEIKDLQEEAENYIWKKITIENVVETLIFADNNQMEVLFSKSLKFIDKNIDVLLKMKKQWEKFVIDHPKTFRKVFNLILNNQSPTECKTSNGSVTDKNMEDINTTNVGLGDFEYLYNSMNFADVAMNIGEKTLQAHKCILISRSKVFRAMFSHDSLESKENRVKITDIDYETMKQLLQYIYCGKVSGLKENAVNLFSAADKYDLMELKDLCRNSMKRNVTVDNVTEILKLTDMHSSYLTDLKEVAMNFFKKNFEKAFESTEWEDFANSNSRILNDILIKVLDSKK